MKLASSIVREIVLIGNFKDTDISMQKGQRLGECSAVESWVVDN